MKPLVNSATARWAQARRNHHPEQENCSQWVKEIRARLGLSQPAFAKLLGVDKITVSRWERKNGQFPEARNIARIQILLNRKEKDGRTNSTTL